MLTSSGQVTITTTEVDPVLGTSGEFLSVTVITGARGQDGAQGPVGPQGPPGDDGAGVVASVVAPIVLTGDVLSFDGSGFDAAGAATAAQAAAIAAAATDATTKANAAQAASQPVDADLTAIAALDSSTAGALVTDGSGWIRKTYAQLKTALALVKGDVGLGSVDNTSDAGKPVSTAQQAALDLKANLLSPTFTGDPKAPTPSAGDNDTSVATTAFVKAALDKQAEVIMVALSDETTAITTGTAKLTMRMPWAFTLTAVRASLTTASSSGIPTVDINEAGTTILSTKLTVDASELTSTTAAVAAVISDPSLADDAEITFDIDVAGTGAKGLKVYLIGTRT